ncbi:MAG: endopeptidase [Rhodospirillales bacterium 20-60-12]|nr:MAG: endopeptidase [Rhodospirillales bacterium 20-60-12]HQT67859.1 trypsin-like peptidase domain-containing protein [Acetobacteraceae bacterium]
MSVSISSMSSTAARALCLALGLLAAPFSAAHSLAMPSSFAPLVHEVSPTIVGISVMESAGMQPLDAPLPPQLSGSSLANRRRAPAPAAQIEAAGSGFIVSASGLIVTNNHVVGNASDIIVTLNDGRRLPGRVIGTDQLTDLAVIKIDAGTKLPYVSWGNSAQVQVGDWILAAGNPFALGNSFTAGIVSARGRDIGDGPFDHFLQLDAPINPGNSGGPDFDMTGRVVGINTAIVSPSGGSVGIGFAIPSDTARGIIDRLISHGSIPRGWLGISVGNLASGGPGVAVTGVQPHGPAAQAGLVTNDIVLAVNGRTVNDSNDLIRAIAAVSPGQRLRLKVDQDGRSFGVNVVVGRRPAELGD